MDYHYFYDMKCHSGICMTVLLITLSGLFFVRQCIAQGIPEGGVIARFSIPDTVCVDQPVPIVNESQGASAYYWRFCTGNAVTNPHGIDLGNPLNTLSAPWGITLVQDGISFFAFVTNSGNGTITRIYWANGLRNQPVAVNLGNFGILTHDVFGIQVENDNGNWYAFVTNGTSLARLDFGTSLLNPIPVPSTVVPDMEKARGLVIEQEGNDWVGFTTNWPGNTITRIHWTGSLAAFPDITNLGNIGELTNPMQPALIRDDTGWYLFIANTTSLSQLYFGNTLLNMSPAGTNLGDLGTMTDDRGLCLFTVCHNPYGLIVNHNLVDRLLLQLHFIGGLGGAKAITPLGIVANMYLPSALSEAVITSDTIYAIALNENSLTTLFFPPCSDTPIPPSTEFEPDSIVFSVPGTYTISLTVDPGMATEQTICKEIEVDTPKPFSFGNDTTICEGSDLLLTPGAGYKNYHWNTGETSSSIYVTLPGTYSVVVTSSYGCLLSDSIHVDVVPNLTETVNPSICWGEKYYAGGMLRSTSGTYFDTLVVQYGCLKIRTTNLVVKPEIIMTLGNDTCLQPGKTIALNAYVPGASDYTWQDNTHNQIYTVTSPGEYRVKVMVDQCGKEDAIKIENCPETISISFPNAFTPNGDEINDLFGPAGTNITNFHMIIYNRWGQILFETSNPGQGWDGKSNGVYCEPGIYVYVAVYDYTGNPPEQVKTTGSFTLAR